MNEQEMQAAVDQLVKDMLDKGLRKPEVGVWIEGAKQPCVFVRSGVYGEADRKTYTEYCPTSAEALDAARAIIAAMPDAETTRLNNFMGALGKVIDLGTQAAFHSGDEVKDLFMAFQRHADDAPQYANARCNHLGKAAVSV